MYNINHDDNNINVKSFLSFFARAQSTVFANKRTFMKKSCTAYNHYDALQSYASYLVLTKKIAQKGHFWPGATKVDLINLKPSYYWMI